MRGRWSCGAIREICLNHGCAAALGGHSEDQRGRLGMRAYCDVLVWPPTITASVKVWPLLLHVRIRAATRRRCALSGPLRATPRLLVWGAVRAGSWNTPVGAACGAAREGGRRGSPRSMPRPQARARGGRGVTACAVWLSAHRNHTFILRARIGQLIRLRRGVSVRYNINKLC